MENFSYPPLQGPNEIRLLTIHPAPFQEQIQCSLASTSLVPLPRYEAISYVWGDPPSTHDICVNGQTLSIRPNLVVGNVMLCPALPEL